MIYYYWVSIVYSNEFQIWHYFPKFTSLTNGLETAAASSINQKLKSEPIGTSLFGSRCHRIWTLECLTSSGSGLLCLHLRGWFCSGIRGSASCLLWRSWPRSLCDGCGFGASRLRISRICFGLWLSRCSNRCRA